MNCGIVMLSMRSIAVQGKKYEGRFNFRDSAGYKPIDAVNNTLIDLILTQKIRIYWVNGRNGVNWEPGTIKSHVGNLFLMCGLKMVDK